MPGITYYRDADVPFFELKVCDAAHVSLKRHYHEEFSVGLVEMGASKVWHEGRQGEVAPENLVLIPPGVFHACNPYDKARWRYKMLFAAPAWVAASLPGGRGKTVLRQGVRCLPARACGRLMAEAAGRLMAPATPLDRESGVLALFAALLGDDGQDGRQGKTGGERDRLKQVREYLHSHFLDRVTLADLEEVSGLSKYYVVKLFRKEYGVPPHVYQTMLRVNFAEKELRRQRELAAVAQDAGFYDQSHFTKTFRSHVGVTPEVYQKAHM
jgi:AraC-like DNA-binding protein